MTEWHKKAYEMSLQGMNSREISQELGIPMETVRAQIKRDRKKNGTQRDPAGRPLTAEHRKNKSKFSYHNGIDTYEDEIEIIDGQPITPELIMKAKGLRPEEWEVVSFTKNIWQSQTKDGGSIDLCQSKLSVKPKREDQITLDMIDELIDAKLEKINFEPISVKNKQMLEIDCADLHCGLLSWAEETGDNYDLHICADRFLSGIRDIVDRAKSKQFDVIYFCGLGDVLHIDNDMNTTTKGTYQQVDGRLPKIFEFTLSTLSSALDMLKELNVPIKYMYLCGNHDRIMGYSLIRCLQLKHTDVEFDVSPNPQKAIHYGKNLIGLSHGDMPKYNKGTWLMNDYRREYGNSDFIEEHCGHIHTEEAKMYHGIMVRSVMAQCGNSLWEHQQGYRSKRGIMCFVWNYESGLRETWYYYY